MDDGTIEVFRSFERTRKDGTLIRMTEGNLLLKEAEALVNTVNCVGAMGKGIAFQFKQAFPENYKEYAKACKVGGVQPGKMFVFETGSFIEPKFIINFPTKRHWRDKSRIADIKSGLIALVAEVKSRNIKSIAIPPLGCGLGGLDWFEVRPLIEETFAELDDVCVYLFEPKGAPRKAARPTNTKRPRMTSTRALVIKLMAQYAELEYELTLLEVQKLAYFLQEAGEEMKLNFHKHHYGPYANNLTKSLTHMEGHFIRGFDGSSDPKLRLRVLPEAVEEADSFLQGNNDALNKLKRVSELIEGFETPYGMEMLSSLHWVAKEESKARSNCDVAIEKVREWNPRKNRIFQIRHLEISWERLFRSNWL